MKIINTKWVGVAYRSLTVNGAAGNQHLEGKGGVAGLRTAHTRTRLESPMERIFKPIIDDSLLVLTQTRFAARLLTCPDIMRER
jgi:hypothetical protein